MNHDGSARHIKLAKHEGNGNDFLVCIDFDDDVHLDCQAIAWLCDRRWGIGADGFIRVLRAGGADAYMELTNADGTRAEMSGNGIRCLVQSLYYLSGDHGEVISQDDMSVFTGPPAAGPPAGIPVVAEASYAVSAVYRIATDAGRRDVSYFAGDNAWMGYASVGMGDVVAGEELPIDRSVLAELTDRIPFWVDAGNPHLVLFGGKAGDGELERVAPQAAALVRGGANVELCWPDVARRHGDDGDLRDGDLRDGDLRTGDDGAYGYAVYERGVGPTLSCGTGAVAAGAAVKYMREHPELYGFGTDDYHGHGDMTITLTSAGGPLEVRFRGNSAILTGPVSKVADIFVDSGRVAGFANWVVGFP
ncbi:MAG: hypothetical protein M1399_04955 [Actinobacteria bacterium]|nr:hypothetical protein [Actinomycetota bacterium]MCL5447218.1 hypothetical protein [Actinomycetota bacterium]